MKNKFRYLKKNSNSLGSLLEGDKSILDADFLLGLYNEAIAAKKEFAKETARIEQMTEILIARAKELGGVVTGVDFEGNNPVPSGDVMDDVIEKIRLAYLAALFAKNLHLLVEAADRGEHGMNHVFEDKTKFASNYAREWSFVVRSNFVSIPCNEKITDKCSEVHGDMNVLEWNGSGYDQDGDWRDSGFPSKWENYSWKLPMSIKKVTDIVWHDAKVKCNPYLDFRHLFFSKMSGGSGCGAGHFSTHVYPVIWGYFVVDTSWAENQYPFGGIGWNDILDVTEIKIKMRDDDKYIGEPKDIK